MIQAAGQFNKGRYECKSCSRHFKKSENEKARVAWRLHSPHVVDRERPDRLPVGPIREWLYREFEAHESMRAFAEIMRAHGDEYRYVDRLLHRWLHEVDTVSLDVFDRFLCAYGRPEDLRVVFPDLYDLPDLDDEDLPVVVSPSVLLAELMQTVRQIVA